MKIKWYGQAAFRLVADDGFTIITDPYTPEILGYEPIPDPADLVIVSSDNDEAHCRFDLIKGDPAVVNALTVAQNGGSHTEAGKAVKAIQAMEWIHHEEHDPDQNGMYRFEVDGMQIAHMGDVGNPLTDEQIAFFHDLDILLALVGGSPTIPLDALFKMLEVTKPKLIIPMHFRTLTYIPRNTHWIHTFLSHYDDADVDFAFNYETTITKADIPDSTRVLVMDYAR